MLQILSCKLSRLCCWKWRDGLWNERLVRKWGTGGGGEGGGRVTSAPAAVITKMWTSIFRLVYRLGPGHIKLTWCFSPHRNQEKHLWANISSPPPCKQVQDNAPLGARSLKSRQSAGAVNNSKPDATSGFEFSHKRGNIASYVAAVKSVYTWHISRSTKCNLSIQYRAKKIIGLPLEGPSVFLQRQKPIANAHFNFNCRGAGWHVDGAQSMEKRNNLPFFTDTCFKNGRSSSGAKGDSPKPVFSNAHLVSLISRLTVNI